MKKLGLLLFGVFCLRAATAQDFPVVSIYGEGISINTVESKTLNEISGLAFGQIHPEFIYVHNDSGGESIVYVLDSLGNEIGEVKLKGANNQDWEDIAVGPGKDGQASIYVGDIGDNSAKRDEIILYRFPEPEQIKKEVEVSVEKIKLTYPDGPMGAETLMVDPLTGDILILSKRDKINTLFRLPASKFGEKETELEEVMKLPITSAVAGDISKDGKQIVIKNYLEIYYWQVKEGESVIKTLSRKPVRLPYVPEPQGEAIGFTMKGDAFYTVSEVRFEVEPILYRFTKD